MTCQNLQNPLMLVTKSPLLYISTITFILFYFHRFNPRKLPRVTKQKWHLCQNLFPSPLCVCVCLFLKKKKKKKKKKRNGLIILVQKNIFHTYLPFLLEIFLFLAKFKDIHFFFLSISLKSIVIQPPLSLSLSLSLSPPAPPKLTLNFEREQKPP